jgi:hypothetical protein
VAERNDQEVPETIESFDVDRLTELLAEMKAATSVIQGQLEARGKANLEWWQRARETLAYVGERKKLVTARFSPDGTRPAGSSPRPPPSRPPMMVLWSPEGRRVLIVDGPVATIWDLQTMRLRLRLVGHEGPLWGAEGPPSAPTVAGATGSDGRTARFRPDGTRLVTAGEDGDLRI